MMDYAKIIESMPYAEEGDSPRKTGTRFFKWVSDNRMSIRSALELAIKVESGEYMLMQKATGKYFMEGDNISIDENGKVITARSEAATKGTR